MYTKFLRSLLRSTKVLLGALRLSEVDWWTDGGSLKFIFNTSFLDLNPLEPECHLLVVCGIYNHVKDSGLAAVALFAS